MTNLTQEIPAEELERMKADAKHKFPFNDRAIFQGLMQDGYIEGAKAEFIRARQQAQGETVKQLLAKEQECEDYRKALEEIISIHKKYYNYGEMNNSTANHLFNIANEVIIKHPSPPTK